MVCKICGEKVPEDYEFCPFCGAKIEREPKRPLYNETGVIGGEYGVAEKLNPTLWIILGALATLFCCMVGGIVTIVYAAKAKNLYGAGDYFNASAKLKTAKIWLLASVIIGFLSTGLQLVLLFAEYF